MDLNLVYDCLVDLPGKGKRPAGAAHFAVFAHEETGAFYYGPGIRSVDSPRIRGLHRIISGEPIQLVLGGEDHLSGFALIPVRTEDADGETVGITGPLDLALFLHSMGFGVVLADGETEQTIPVHLGPYIAVHATGDATRFAPTLPGNVVAFKRSG